ncbi:MAG: 3-deoxy-7-phosphoheptulonate synthase [SAR86 cluster bacterium]|jgi:3-deoxy-7-phosphoheptulonate synthase|nr:3-deoxy-7-phosphoheptulonate synthase [SAR86 cluster bacterium]
MRYQTDNTRIIGKQEILSAEDLIKAFPLSEKVSKLVYESRNDISNIISKKDDRLMVVVGPCSIHDPEAALEYANLLKKEAKIYENELKIIMRVYFEKPRTTVGWKGLINDPDIDNTYNINKGLKIARQLLLNLNDLGLTSATEFLDVITPQYIADIISWGAIGARTTESQVHRELASGISCPIGFKNSTEGSIQVSIDAIKSAKNPHIFLSVTKEGKSAIFESSGNEDCHIILRGGKEPNYDSTNVAKSCNLLHEANLPETLMIDMSHGNSTKQHKKQLEVCKNIGDQISNNEKRITGVMIESNLVEGNQPDKDKSKFRYGQSITDACIDWKDTTSCLEDLARSISKRRNLS